ncbi:hypothetical protein [Aureispira anguillae]|uniref:Uncharacterized protein n=1 Tax=Aureispira anguillae TaxID=2864201 RepID=A0A915YBM3_9BACT|nr:hypothetical protein [Aureispira anguillae]BDS10095.1 hypothetical protein AsAng_0008020 [Aureispira anguillae]
MKAIQKYWWVLALVLVLLFLLLVSKASNDKKGTKGAKNSNDQGCKEISWADFKGKKQYYYNENGGNWTLAHAQVLDEGYCEHTGT